MRKSIAMLLAAPMVLTSLPVQAQASKWTNWTRMNPDSYKFDFATMGERCLSGAAVTTVTEAECREAKQMVEAGSCPYVPIPNGTRYEFMNGLKAGSPYVYQMMIKQLPGVHMAYSCKLQSTGRIFDWYVGQTKKSCGNLGARERVLEIGKPIDNPTLQLIPEVQYETRSSMTTSEVPTGQSVVTVGGMYYPTYRGGNTNIEVGAQAKTRSTNTNTDGGDCNICQPRRH